MSKREGFGKYHICPVCGKTFYVTCRIEKWAYRCKVKSKTYTLCSYSCTTKAINDSEAIKDDFVRHEKTISSEIAEIESKKQKKTIPPAHSFNEWTERKVTYLSCCQEQESRLRLIVTSILPNSGTEDMNNETCYIHNRFCIRHADNCSHEQFLGGREMIDNEKYQKELIRMWESVRDDNKGYPGCRGVKCKKCPLYDIKWDDIGCGYSIYAVKMINIVEKWSKEHPKKYKVSKFEFDFLEENLKWVEGAYYLKFSEMMQLEGLLEKGYFKGATKDMSIKDYFDNCEVKEDV